jgi:hypothetical protein
VNYALALLAYFVAVSLKSYQQRQVGAAEYRRMPIVSFGMAACEVFMVSMVVRSSDSVWGLVFLALAMGTGGSLGSIFGTWLHARKH